MSYSEYLDLFKTTQKKECPYRAFTFDVVCSRKQMQYIMNKETHDKVLCYVYSLLEKEEMLINRQILLKDKFNLKYVPLKDRLDGNIYNFMVLGDMVTYFVYNGSITTKRMIEIFVEALKKFDINYSFHFATGVYETNNYAKGGTLMYKGYMPQILENLSKKNKLVITKNGVSKEIIK